MSCGYFFFCIFFCQAEDGIRYLVRSRGLGDVYKRQENILITLESPRQIEHGDLATNIAMNLAKPLRKNPRAIAEEILLNLNYDNSLISSIEIAGAGSVSYTHLTLPTSDLV